MSLTEDDIKALADEIDRRRENYIVPPKKHLSDHDFIDRIRENEPDWREVIHWVAEQRKKEQDRNNIRNRIIGGLGIAAILGLCGFVGALIWDGAVKLISKMAGG